MQQPATDWGAVNDKQRKSPRERPVIRLPKRNGRPIDLPAPLHAHEQLGATLGATAEPRHRGTAAPPNRRTAPLAHVVHINTCQKAQRPVDENGALLYIKEQLDAIG